VSVNVSSRQLQLPGFDRLVETLLVEHRLDSSCLELEISEKVLMDDHPETLRNLTRVCDIGVRLSIDDFGRGGASLYHFQRYPFSTLKIDRSFISGMLTEPNTARLVEGMIAMAHSMGLQVTAIGVETQAQLDFLRARHCDLAQGYWFSRPAAMQTLLLRYAPSH
jgi:EAL domain-containing protein (putative c-di-GMP-specific phosphodiesterase class I)